MGSGGPSGGASGGGATGPTGPAGATGATGPTGASNSIQSVTVPLTANQINHLFSAPVTLIATPGAGKMIVPLQVITFLHSGTVAFGKVGASVGFFFGTTANSVPGTLDVVEAADNISTAPLTITANSAPLANTAIIAGGLVDDFVNGGTIVTSNVHAGGAGLLYAPGDTGGINSAGVVPANYTIDTVGAGGAVLTYHLTNGGSGSPISSNVGTFTSTGSGDGNFAIDITAITPGNGSASVTLFYTIQTLP